MEKTSQKMHYRLSKNERLHSRNLIDQLFKEGKRKNSGCLTGFYLVVENNDNSVPLQMMTIVSRKRFKRAVKRNLLKRRIREAYRLNKHLIYNNLKINQKNLAVAFVYRRDEIRAFTEIEKAVIDILKFLKSV